MAGNRNSGRRSYFHEVQKGKLEDICIKWLINNFPKFDKETKIKVALEIAKKAVVQKHEFSGEIQFTIQELHKKVKEYEPSGIIEARRSICIN
jgi:hypothetical protein